MARGHPADAMLARRIVRGGYRTAGDSIIPETPEYDGNLTGDLAQVPAGKTFKAGPIRLPVGAAEGVHRGLGIEHMADNAKRDAARMPKAQTGDLAEDLARQAVQVLRGAREVHHDGSKFIFPNPLMKQAVVAAWRGDHYSITTVRPYSNAQSLWGNSERVGRLTFPTRDAATASPSIAVARESALHPDRFGLEATSEHFDFSTGKPKAGPQVVVKKKRTIQAPAGAGAPLLSRAAATTAGRQIETEAFRNWFGNSKVVDDEGKPLVMYHGSNHDIERFEPNHIGLIFVSPSPEEANGFTGARGGATTNEGVVYPVYVAASNPFDFERKGHIDALMKRLPPGSPTRRADIERGHFPSIEDDEQVLRAIRALGHDGLYVMENAKNLAVFRPEQIKSAIGNNGNFDGANSDIRLSRARALPSTATWAQQPNQMTPAQRADALIHRSARSAQPLDAVARAITRATGVEWATKKLGGALSRYTPETVKAGLVSDYGLDPRVRDERVLMQARQQVQLRKAGQMIDSLASLTRDESAAAYRWMNETDPQAIIRGMDELPEGPADPYAVRRRQRIADASLLNHRSPRRLMHPSTIR